MTVSNAAGGGTRDPTCENTISGPIFPGHFAASRHLLVLTHHLSCHNGRTALRITSLLAGLWSLCPGKRPEQTLFTTVTTTVVRDHMSTTMAMTTTTTVTAGTSTFTQTLLEGLIQCAPILLSRFVDYPSSVFYDSRILRLNLHRIFDIRKSRLENSSLSRCLAAIAVQPIRVQELAEILTVDFRYRRNKAKAQRWVENP